MDAANNEHVDILPLGVGSQPLWSLYSVKGLSHPCNKIPRFGYGSKREEPPFMSLETFLFLSKSSTLKFLTQGQLMIKGYSFFACVIISCNSLGPLQRIEVAGLRQSLAFLRFLIKLASYGSYHHPSYPSFLNWPWPNSLSPLKWTW